MPLELRFSVVIVVSFFRYSASTFAPSSHRLLLAKLSISSVLLLSRASQMAATPSAAMPLAPKSTHVATSLNAKASLTYVAPSFPRFFP